MASFLSYSLLLSILVITTFTSITMSDDDPNYYKQIEKICRQMEDYGFCAAVFRQNEPSDRFARNILTLAKITIREAETNATNTSLFIQKLSANTTDPTMKNYLLVCTNAYNIVAKSFNQAMDSLNHGDFRSMLKYEQGTPRAAASCVTIFQTPPTRPSPLNERNREMRILLTMAVVTGDELANE